MRQKRYRSAGASKSHSLQTNFQLEGFWLHLVRGVWIALVLAELVITILTLFASRTYALVICPGLTSNCGITPATAQALHHLGIAPASYVTYNLVLALLESLIFLSVGGIIFWHKSSEPICLAASFVFVNLGLLAFFTTSSYPPAVVSGYIAANCFIPAAAFFLVTFPDGRFMPRWSWLLVVLWLVQAIFFEIPGTFNILSWPTPLLVAELLLTYGGTIGLQIYRYVRVFSYFQRQQTKWLVFGFAGFVALNFLTGLIASLFPGLAAPDSTYQLLSGMLSSFIFLIIPLSVGIAIQRYRLWDIDTLIRRTLVYTMLTVILALIYVGLVFAFGSLLRDFFGQQQNPVVIVASTLMIAALFQPFRQFLQRFIDRRFYRSKYDAATTLTNFTATLRSEVDLEQLSDHLLTVVQETMQPSTVSLWLRRPEKNTSTWSQKPSE